ncbi:DoxX family protein [Gordonia sp. CPCC 205515]|uniref:DoxX family protein n=1 Tax=Gordonia sp. CPCC 205515 TaxID=3140791 RepID=UPI003AF3753D
MTVAYWIVAAVLAVFYLYSGGMKMIRSQEQLAPMMAWAGTTIPMTGVRAIGAVEVLGAIGLILPPLTGIAPGLALWAAIGFVVLQVLATGFHLSRGETKQIGLNIGLIVLSAFSVWLATVWI